jgi:hypothetical protein
MDLVTYYYLYSIVIRASLGRLPYSAFGIQSNLYLCKRSVDSKGVQYSTRGVADIK